MSKLTFKEAFDSKGIWQLAVFIVGILIIWFLEDGWDAIGVYIMIFANNLDEDERINKKILK